MRGEDGIWLRAASRMLGSPPHARGRRVRAGQEHPVRRITPACAGKTAGSGDSDLFEGDHPRMRGEDIGTQLKNGGTSGSPPHARGRRSRLKPVVFLLRITPACAGKTRTTGPDLATTPDHPRMRGEDQRLRLYPLPWAGSPPHARGRPRKVLLVVR